MEDLCLGVGENVCERLSHLVGAHVGAGHTEDASQAHEDERETEPGKRKTTCTLSDLVPTRVRVGEATTIQGGCDIWNRAGLRGGVALGSPHATLRSG